MSGESRGKAELIRFVLAPDHRVVPDLAETLPGRGAWVLADRQALQRAATKGVFARAFASPADVSPNLASDVERLLVARCIDRLHLARRAGAVVAGRGAVERWLKAGRAGVLLVAADGDEARHPGAKLEPTVPRLRTLTAEELGRPFGRAKIGCIALASGGIAKGLVGDLRRLEGLRDEA